MRAAHVGHRLGFGRAAHFGLRSVFGWAESGLRSVFGWAESGLRSVFGRAESGLRSVFGRAESGLRSVLGWAAHLGLRLFFGRAGQFGATVPPDNYGFLESIQSFPYSFLVFVEKDILGLANKP